MSFDFTGQVVMVCGATGALGHVVAKRFAEAGANLALLARNSDLLAQQFPEAALNPQHLLSESVDVHHPDQIKRFVETALARWGRIDAMVNTIGGFKAGPPVYETPLADWDFMLDLNARSAFALSQAVAPAMIHQGYGSIVHTSGRAGLSAFAGGAGYCAAKSAVIRLTEALSAELRDSGIRVNCVLPGTIDTPDNRAARPDADRSRWVEPDALAEVIMFLCSPAARAIHGAAIPVFGLG